MVLRLDSVSKRYGAHTALADVSLHVREGDCYGFLGHNGAGKSTALRIALGLVRPDRGRVYVAGFDVFVHPREARARQGGLVETPGFYSWMTGRQNLRLLARLKGVPRREAGPHADRLLEDLGLTEARDRAVGGYSQGMRQRLGIAQALVADPPVLLLDEPTNGLDPEGMEEFRKLLRRLREEGRTVLVSSHQLRELADVCNRIAILRKGRLLVEGETEALVAAGEGRLVLRTADPRPAVQTLAALGVPVLETAGDRLVLDARASSPAAVAKALVAGNVEIAELAPLRRTLEDIYLEYARSGEVAPPDRDPPPPPVPPAERRAPPWPVFRVFGQELRRTLTRAGPILLFALPSLLAVLSIFWQHSRSTAHEREVAEGELVSHSMVTAFEAATAALRDAMPLLALIAAGLASQAVAGEYSRGTLRNLLLCPIDRARLAFGKALGVLAIALGAYVLLVGSALTAASIAFDFTDVVEILEIRGAEPWVLVKAEALVEPFTQMLLWLALPLAAWSAVGFLAGVVARSGAAALTFAGGLYVLFEFSRVVGREFGFEKYLLSAHVPSPLGDTSWTARVLGLIRAPNDLPAGYAEEGIEFTLAWLLLSILAAALLLSRRSVP